METSIMAQGVELMLIGMGTVFVFLTTLVAATSLMSALVGSDSEPALAAATATGDEPDDEELAAISAAITRHRQQ